MAQESGVHIKTGDLVTLFAEESEEDGYLACGGLNEDQVIVKKVKDKDCVFRIVPMVQYVEGLGAGVAESENAAKWSAHLEGKPIVYGQIVQLWHVRMQRFVSSVDEKGGHELKLAKEGSRACWFKVVPHGSGADVEGSNGQKVPLRAKVRFEHDKSGGFLHQADRRNSRSQQLVDLQDPSAATAWVVQLSDVGSGLVRDLVPIT